MQLAAVIAAIVMCVLHKANAGVVHLEGYNGEGAYPHHSGGHYEKPIIEIEPEVIDIEPEVIDIEPEVIDIEPEVVEVPMEYIEDPVEISYELPTGYHVKIPNNPLGWNLDNFEVVTGSTASGKHDILTGGSTSADDPASKTRHDLNINFGMIGGDGGDNENTYSSGIEYNGGDIINFLSKIQGYNNQGVDGGKDLVKLLRRVYASGKAGSYLPPVVAAGGYQPKVVAEGGYQPPVIIKRGYEPIVVL